jgi:hypothetical protein
MAKSSLILNLGELAYVGHDPKREKPVHFSWQLRNWPIPIHILRHMRLDIEGDDLKSWEQSTPQSLPSTEMNKIAEGVTLLQLRDVRTSGPSKRRFLPRIDINFSKKSEAASELGRLGENLVVTHEKESLKDIDRPDLAEKVVHVAKEKGDGAGYDVLSYF